MWFVSEGTASNKEGGVASAVTHVMADYASADSNTCRTDPASALLPTPVRQLQLPHIVGTTNYYNRRTSGCTRSCLCYK